jgi:hypothetical protein
MTDSPSAVNVNTGPSSFQSGFPVAAVLFFTILLSGCAVWPTPARSIHVGETGPAGRCAGFFSALDERISRAGVIDGGYARIRHFPYLRVDRFLASFRNEINSDLAFRSWINRLQSLDRAARRAEIANLTDSENGALESEAERETLLRRVDHCGDLLKAVDFSDGGGRDDLSKAAVAPDDYISIRRVLGLYPLAAPFVAHGVAKWHTEARQRFSVGAPADWRSIRYAPLPMPKSASARQILDRAVRDGLGIPAYSEEDVRQLFQLFAPVWEVQHRGHYDRIGSPQWESAGRIGVDTDRPRVYTRLSFTRFGGDTLTQLSFIVWFSARPKTSALDLYGGRLDGLTYRVTLDNEGRPILYETIHNCGCYYKAYPTRHLQVRQTIPYKEPPLILNSPESGDPSKAMVVAVESRTHYVAHLYTISSAAAHQVPYTLIDYGALLSLPLPGGGHKSMFNPYGIAAGSERLERFILWPTGVPSPGAMRQWGRHAVAFVGRRHFDDPFTMDHLFIPKTRQ